MLTDAPLADWVVNGRFPTHEMCESNRSNSEAAVAYAIGKEGGEVGPAVNVVLKARCIELDDLKRRLRPPADDLLD